MFVVSRAGNRCEYCLIHQDLDSQLRFHVEHILPRQHGGKSDKENLALACHHCNLHKGPNLAGIDPHTLAIAPLFNPRTDNWSDHFALNGPLIVGLTPAGRHGPGTGNERPTTH